MKRSLSPQQAAALEAVIKNVRNLIVQAVAGSGKTTFLEECARTIPRTKTVAFCCFGKAIATEIEQRIKPFNLDNVTVGTMHSFSFGAVRRAFSRVKVDANKLRNIARNEFTGEYENLQQFVIAAAAMAKEVGVGAIVDNTVENWLQMCDKHNLWDSLPAGVTEAQGIDAAQYLLSCNNNIKNVIDFSDMIYFTILFDLKIWQYDYILLDEAQDTNGPRRALAKKMLKKGGKLIAVGDPCQAIFGFTGADNRSLDIIREEFDCEIKPLSVTFRCPKSIVQVANQWVSHIEAHESAPDGIVDSCELSDISKLVGPKDAIVCRNTKPLVELAYSLLRQQIACRVEGRKIGEGLVKLAQRWKTVKNVGELYNKLQQWSENEIEKNKKKGNDTNCQVIEDQVKTLEVFISECDNSDPISTLVANIRSLFGDTEGEQKVLTLSTIHKAKGKEWDRVFALGMDTYSPSKWATKAWEMEQEDYLCYVQVTRAKQHLTLVNVPAKNS
jgi:DNA helicase-2/ATP-dependent DNA helicase PcrA